MPVTDNKFERCSDDDPNRCQSLGGAGQCPFKAVEGFKYCPRHNSSAARSDANKKANQYRLQVWQERVGEFAESNNVKSLRDEIGILRLLMETTLQKCTDAQDLLMYSGKIADLSMRIEKLVTSCNRLEKNMGMMLDKTAALTLAGQIVEIITRHVTDSTVVDEISNEIITAIASIGKSET